MRAIRPRTADANTSASAAVDAKAAAADDLLPPPPSRTSPTAVEASSLPVVDVTNEALLSFFSSASTESQLQRTIEASDDESYEVASDRWVGPFACVELAELRLEAADARGAAQLLDRASSLPPRHFSFHSWHQARVREVRGRVARSGGGVSTPAADGEEEGDEPEEIVRLRREIEAAEEQVKAAIPGTHPHAERHHGPQTSS